MDHHQSSIKTKQMKHQLLILILGIAIGLSARFIQCDATAYNEQLKQKEEPHFKQEKKRDYTEYS